MAETTSLGLPLVAGSQAQKHVTVNEAFARIDALAQLTLESTETTTPPNAPLEGEVWAVPPGATGLWTGQAGRVALFLNGGWAFVSPRVGWRGFVVDRGITVHFDGTDWIEGVGAVSPSGAGFLHRSIEIDHVLTGGSVSVAADAIPAQSIVYGVTGRVIEALGGPSGFQIGVSGSANRYGSGYGTSGGSWMRGLTSTPLTYYSPTDLVLTAEGADFDGSGRVRLVIHFAELSLPRA